MNVNALIGPGHHSKFLLDALMHVGILRRSARSWPQFLVEQETIGGRERKVVATAKISHHIEHLSWALWRRLPHIGQYDTPRILFCAAADRMAMPYMIDDCELFVGWSQMSLQCLRQARKRGVPTLLEHPMAHANSWRIIDEENVRWKTRSGSPTRFSGALLRRMKDEYEVADRIMTLSTYARRTFLEAGVPESKLLQIPLGVDTEKFSPGPERNGPFRIIYVGRIELLKGLPYLLQAFSSLGDKHTELWLVGQPFAEMNDILRRHSDDRIKVFGNIEKDALPDLYRQADVLVFPSLNDSFGMVILEAMSAGIPVIASENCAGPDLIEDGINGFVVPIRDADSLKNRIERLAEDRPLARTMGLNARSHAISNFTWAHYHENIASVYASIAACP